MSATSVVHVLGTGERHAKGIALTVLHLAESMDPSRYRLSAMLLQEDGPVGTALRDAGLDVRKIGWHDGSSDFLGAMRFARELRSLEPDIVHLHAGGLSPRVVSKMLAGAKVIVHYHSLQEEALTDAAPSRNGLSADLIIANSKATAKSVKKSKALVVYPGVKVGPPRIHRHEDPVTVGVAARLVPVKGIEYLIEAVSQTEGIELEIAGDGPERDKLREIAGNSPRVRFIGWIDDVGLAMSRWDIYAQPSVAEGLGIGALEAMAHGIPVIASNVGGLAEIVVDGETGCLVPPRDPDAIAEALRELAASPALRASYGLAAQARVAEHFSREKETEAISEAYDKLHS